MSLKGEAWSGIGGLYCSILGIVFSLLVEPMRVMTGYSEWINLGMPAPNEHRLTIFTSFAALSVIGLGLIFYLNFIKKPTAPVLE